MDNKMILLEDAYNNGGYCSIALVDEDAKRRLFNAVQNPDYSLKEKVNTTINMVDLYVEPVDIAEKDEDGNLTGNIHTAPRVVILDDKGKSYSCCSVGVYNSLKRLLSPVMFGDPSTWEKPLAITPYIVSKGKGQVLFIKLA